MKREILEALGVLPLTRPLPLTMVGPSGKTLQRATAEAMAALDCALTCTTCGNVEAITTDSAERYMAQGWPKCCPSCAGPKMNLETAAARASRGGSQ